MKSVIFIFTLIIHLALVGQNIKADSIARYPTNMSVKEYTLRIANTNKLVLVNFAADWCVMCKKQKPILDQLLLEKKEVLEVIIIDMEKNPEIAEYFNVDGLPINLLYKNGNLVWDQAGLKTKNELLREIVVFEK